jgi:hypothetical protein
MGSHYNRLSNTHHCDLILHVYALSLSLLPVEADTAGCVVGPPSPIHKVQSSSKLRLERVLEVCSMNTVSWGRVHMQVLGMVTTSAFAQTLAHSEPGHNMDGS